MGVPAPATVGFAIHGPIARSDLPGLCERVCSRLTKSRAEVAVCDVSGVEVDAVTIDALARLQVAAGRHGCKIRLCGACDELLALLEFMGLTDVLPCTQPTRRTAGGPEAARGRSEVF